MSDQYNDIDNVNVGTTSNYNDIDNVKDRFSKSKKVERIADELVNKLGNVGYRPFYCKIAWKLTEGQIWRNYEAAFKANPLHPQKLFAYLCKRDGV